MSQQGPKNIVLEGYQNLFLRPSRPLPNHLGVPGLLSQSLFESAGQTRRALLCLLLDGLVSALGYFHEPRTGSFG